MDCLPQAEHADTCWICLQGGELVQPCKCPMPVHKQCLASWQLHAAGTREELQCRFCNAVLPDWKAVLHNTADTASVVAAVALVYCGNEYRLAVQHTIDGLQRFKRQVEHITGIPLDDCAEVRFFCRSPKGQYLKLKGAGSLDAAVYCAAVAASEREQRQKLLAIANEQHGCDHNSTNAVQPILQDWDLLQFWHATVHAEAGRDNFAVHSSSSNRNSSTYPGFCDFLEQQETIVFGDTVHGTLNEPPAALVVDMQHVEVHSNPVDRISCMVANIVSALDQMLCWWRM